MQEPSVFSLIYKGELPGEIIYKDNQCFVLLTNEPLTPGHAMVVPNEQIDMLWDVDDPLYHHLFDVAKKIAAAMGQAYDYKRVGLLVEGFGVPHVHVHVIGLNEGFEPTVIRHAATKHPLSIEELKVEANKLRACL